jgi:hypothetical protein
MTTSAVFAQSATLICIRLPKKGSGWEWCVFGPFKDLDDARTAAEAELAQKHEFFLMVVPATTRPEGRVELITGKIMRPWVCRLDSTDWGWGHFKVTEEQLQAFTEKSLHVDYRGQVASGS